MNFEDTLADDAWLNKYVPRIKAVLPRTPTHVNNLNWNKILFRFKQLGLDWQDRTDVMKIFSRLHMLKVIIKDGHCIKANTTDQVFS